MLYKYPHAAEPPQNKVLSFMGTSAVAAMWFIIARGKTKRAFFSAEKGRRNLARHIPPQKQTESFRHFQGPCAAS